MFSIGQASVLNLLIVTVFAAGMYLPYFFVPRKARTLVLRGLYLFLTLYLVVMYMGMIWLGWFQ